MSGVVSPFAPEPAPPFRDSAVRAEPLRFWLKSGRAVTRDDIASIIAERKGRVREIRLSSNSVPTIEWWIEFHPVSISGAAQTIVALLDLGQLSFALAGDSVGQN